jgi:hypothetical protein
MVEAQGLRDMRMRALDAIYRVTPVRRVLMQTGSARGAEGSEIPQEKVGGPHRVIGFAMRRALGHGVIHHPFRP